MNELTNPEPRTTALAEQDFSAAAIALDEKVFARVVAMGELMASAKATIPQHLRGSKGDCTAVAMQAFRWRMDPFAVAQKTHLVNGALGYEAQLVNAAITTMAPTKDRLHFSWFGPWEKIVGKFVERQSQKKDDDGNAKTYRAPAWKIEDEVGLGVKVWATMKGEAEPRELELLLTQARTRNSTLWADDPKQQLAYLATKRWSRLYCPDVILGVYTPDEIDEHQPAKAMGNAERVDDKAEAKRLSQEELDRWMAEAKKGRDSVKKFWREAGDDFRKRATEPQKEETWDTAVKADKERTVDNGATPTNTTVSPPPGDASIVSPAADPEIDSFRAEMEEAERRAAAAGSAT